MQYRTGTKYTIEWEDSLGSETWMVTDGKSDPAHGVTNCKTPFGQALLSSATEYPVLGKIYKFKIFEIQLPENLPPPYYPIPAQNTSFTNSRLSTFLITLNSDIFRKKIYQPLPKLESNDYLLAWKWYSG